MILPPPLLEVDLADSRELDAPLVELDATSQSEAVLLALALEPREADLLFGPGYPFGDKKYIREHISVTICECVCVMDRIDCNHIQKLKDRLV